MPYYGHTDPREGEWPEESEMCWHHRRRETCGECADIDSTSLTAQEIELELQRVVLKKLDEIAMRGRR